MINTEEIKRGCFPAGGLSGLSSETSPQPPPNKTKQNKWDNLFMHCHCSYPQETVKGGGGTVVVHSFSPNTQEAEAGSSRLTRSTERVL